MVGGQLRVDTPTLHSIGDEFSAVASELTHADAHAEGAAVAVGHPGLARAVRAFTDDWQTARAEMVARIERLGQSAALAGETFDRTDARLAGSRQQ